MTAGLCISVTGTQERHVQAGISLISMKRALVADGKVLGKHVPAVVTAGEVVSVCNAQFHVSRSADFLTNTSHQSLKERAGMDLVRHTGGCHCGAVRFEVRSSPDLHVFHCNCSICTKKQNHHFIVPKKNFTLIQGLDNLTTYTFNTHAAKHTFCKTCGVQSFYTPRSNPDGYGVAPHCLDQGTVRSVTVEKFCGEKWEESMQAHKSIRDMSKPAAE